MPKCKMLVLINQKGGTAKTTTTLNLRIGLAHQEPKELLVNADTGGDLITVLIGLRRSEINGLKYSDVDYINRMLRVECQLGKKPNSKAEDKAPKMLTKQEIKTKTTAGVREFSIPNYVFEAILEERKTYEKNRRHRPNEFRDWNYICCSTYGNPRSKGYHQKYYKDLLKSLDLPDIHFHQLGNTYATILLNNSFNSKGVSHLLGYAKEIISVDVYGDTQEIIEDCLDVLELFIKELFQKSGKISVMIIQK